MSAAYSPIRRTPIQRTMARLNVGVLISGRGSNLEALIEAAADPAYPAEIALVISNRPEAPGLGRAARAGIAHRVIAEHEPRRPSPRRPMPHCGKAASPSSRWPGICASSTALLSRLGAIGSSTSIPHCCLPSPGFMRSGRRSPPGSGFPAAPCISCATQSIPGRSSRRRSCRCSATMTRRACRAASSRPSTGSIRWRCGSSPKAGCASTGNTVAVAGAEAPEGVMLNPPEALVSRAG